LATEFCGIDGECKPYSCDNWYQFSTWNLPEVAGPLECEPVTSGNIWTVVYACQNFNQGPNVAFNQKCSATMESTTFNCYNFTEDFDFTPFTSSYADIAPDCSDNNLEEDAVTFPFFQYRVTFDDPDERSPTTIELHGDDTSQTFEPELALHTIFVEMVSDDPPPTPTPEDGTSTTDQGNPDSRASTFGMSATSMILGSMIGIVGALF
jgi:hypothetical protein